MARNNDTRKRLVKLILCALFAALIAVGSWISFPLPITQVPINLALLPVLMAGALLGAEYGLICTLVYILIGAVGVPVFSGFSAGVGILAGPTGGYIIGYAAAAFITGLLTHHKSHPPIWLLILGMACGVLACYVLGTGWFMVATKSKFAPALGMCVLPFLPGDAVKIVVAALISRTLEKVTPG